MSRPNRNGISANENPARKNRGRGNRMDSPLVLAGGRTPVGPAPKGSGQVWGNVWRRLQVELPWLDVTHRLVLEEALDIMRKRVEIADYFQARKAQMKRDGKLDGDAYLTDGGLKRHPLAVHDVALSDALRRTLTSLGATPQSQLKLMAAAGKAALAKRANGESKETSPTDYFDA